MKSLDTAVLLLTTVQAESGSGFLNALLDILEREEDNGIRLSGTGQQTQYSEYTIIDFH